MVVLVLIRSRAMSSISLPIDIWYSSGVAACVVQARQFDTLRSKDPVWLQKVRNLLHALTARHIERWGFGSRACRLRSR